MAFDSVPAAVDLTLQNTTNTRVLRDLESPFAFLAPQEIADLGDTFYPFIFDDAKRYFAMPTYDRKRHAAGIFANPSITLKIPDQDAIVNTVPLPDKGDPAPFWTHAPPALLGRAAATARASYQSVRVLSDTNGPALVVRDERVTSDLVIVEELPFRSVPMMQKQAGGFAPSEAVGVDTWLARRPSPNCACCTSSSTCSFIRTSAPS